MQRLASASRPEAGGCPHGAMAAPAPASWPAVTALGCLALQTSGWSALAKATSSRDSLMWLCTAAPVSAASAPSPCSSGGLQEGTKRGVSTGSSRLLPLALHCSGTLVKGAAPAARPSCDCSSALNSCQPLPGPCKPLWGTQAANALAPCPQLPLVLCCSNASLHIPAHAAGALLVWIWQGAGGCAEGCALPGRVERDGSVRAVDAGAHRPGPHPHTAQCTQVRGGLHRPLSRQCCKGRAACLTYWMKARASARLASALLQ